MILSRRQLPFLILFCLALVLGSRSSVRAEAPFGDDSPKSSAAFAPPAFAPPPTALALNAPAYFLMDMGSGRVLAQKNAYARMFPASTTKIMTCLVALEHGKLNQVITVGKDSAATGESGIGLLAGEQFTLADLIRAALIHSANDACVAIAEGVAGSQPKFVGWMNQKARALGCKGTHFMNPHGLHDPNHYTCAHDLAIIARAALKEPFFNATVGTHTAVLHGNAKVPQRFLVNRNRLLFRWSQCDGVKTGYTREAGNCLVATATEIDAHSHRPWRLLSVVMKEHGGDAWPESQELLQNAGFDRYRPVLVARKGDVLATQEISGAATELEACPAHDIRIPLLTGEAAELTQDVHLLPASPPIASQHVVGTIAYFAGNNLVARLPLVAREDVPLSLSGHFLPLGHLNWRHPVGEILALALASLAAASLLTFVKLKSRARRRTSSPRRVATRPT